MKLNGYFLIYKDGERKLNTTATQSQVNESKEDGLSSVTPKHQMIARDIIGHISDGCDSYFKKYNIVFLQVFLCASAQSAIKYRAPNHAMCGMEGVHHRLWNVHDD